MNLSSSYTTIRQSHICESLAFSPTPFAVKLAKTRPLANRWASRESLDFYDRAQDVEEHSCGILTEAMTQSLIEYVRRRASSFLRTSRASRSSLSAMKLRRMATSSFYHFEGGCSLITYPSREGTARVGIRPPVSCCSHVVMCALRPVAITT